MKWYLKVMQENYANFDGRARRKEYWMFVLIQMLVMIMAMILDGVLGLGFELGNGIKLPYGWIYFLAVLAHFIPNIGVSVRRLHDVGKSGWFWFIGLIPFIGVIWLLVLACTDGDSSDNEFGPSPKAA